MLILDTSALQMQMDGSPKFTIRIPTKESYQLSTRVLITFFIFLRKKFVCCIYFFYFCTQLRKPAPLYLGVSNHPSIFELRSNCK